MTKLYSPRGWLGYFVGCKSEAMYYIYSLKKYKVYWIGVARVEDRERLNDPYNAPCLEDRVLILNVKILDRLSLKEEKAIFNDKDLYNLLRELKSLLDLKIELLTNITKPYIKHGK
jgi:hypothetical protein